jgi:bifunctional non-homologous end joining protein LigD
MIRRHYGRYAVDLSNVEKLLFPESGIAKKALIDYYERIADLLIPHIRGRPLVLQRFPDGIDHEGFFQKRVPNYFPDWIERKSVRLLTRDESQDLVVCDNRATLAYLVNQACITLHPWLSRCDRLQNPDTLVVDLDPPGEDFDSARRAALCVRELFEDLDLPCYVKVTGSKGLHIHVPLDRSEDFDAVRDFAGSAMDLLERRHSDLVTTEQRKKNRANRVYLDIARNAYGQTAVAPWCVRALPGAPVAAPIAWWQVERSDLGPRDYTIENVFRCIADREDPWNGHRRHARSLEAARDALDRIVGRAST